MDGKIVCRMISAVIVDRQEIKIEAQACVTEDNKRFLRIINEEDEVVEIDDLESIKPIYERINSLHDTLIDTVKKAQEQ